MNILMIGDVVAAAGMEMIRRRLGTLKKMYQVDFTVVNGENARGVGISPDDAETIYRAGADVITLGNHAFRFQQIKPFLEECPYLLRPLNYSPLAQGRGDGVFEVGGVSVRVINLIGRCMMDFAPDNPFLAVDRALKKEVGAAVTLVDFHAQATSEKEAMGYFLDGRVSVLAGTHTHVQTADEKVLPGGTGYISDLGMTGALRSVLGVVPEHSISMFLGENPPRLDSAVGPSGLCGALFDVDPKDGRCREVRRVQIHD